MQSSIVVKYLTAPERFPVGIDHMKSQSALKQTVVRSPCFQAPSFEGVHRPPFGAREVISQIHWDPYDFPTRGLAEVLDMVRGHFDFLFCGVFYL